ncbi:hypothetical protein OSTOST_06261 [Ostertagia ostertagi]
MLKQVHAACWESAMTIRVAATAKIEVSLQNPTGCFDIPRFDTDGFTVSNVAVRLSRNDTNQPRIAVLLNCHYDSWPSRAGGWQGGRRKRRTVTC